MTTTTQKKPRRGDTAGATMNSEDSHTGKGTTLTTHNDTRKLTDYPVVDPAAYPVPRFVKWAYADDVEYREVPLYELRELGMSADDGTTSLVWFGRVAVGRMVGDTVAHVDGQAVAAALRVDVATNVMAAAVADLAATLSAAAPALSDRQRDRVAAILTGGTDR